MKSATIISKPGKPEAHQVAPEVAGWLRQHGIDVTVDRESSHYTPGYEVVDRSEIARRRPDFVVVLGGDGTMLSAARAVAEADIPILGVNLGSLGFMTEVPLDELYPTLEALLANRCEVDRRSMIHCQLEREGKCIAAYEALNDVVVSKSAIARIVDFDVFVARAFVSSYKADGLILSTPTGSTAYSLAAGGPIVTPDVDAFIITPISSHALTNRALVVRDSAEIMVVMKSTQQEGFLSVDGQVGIPVQDGDLLRCRKSEHTISLLRLSKRSFFDVLRTKLKWGER